MRSRFLITAVGGLSVHQLPDIEGLGDFAGETFHTARLPRDGVDLSGKRVGVIGTGATGVQVIQTIAAEVSHLTVFQRTPNYCIPQRNSGIRTSGSDHSLDAIIFATGFDAVTGPLNRIDIRGLNEASLRNKWCDGPKTYLGLQVEGFPNLFTIAGPHNAASLCNAVRCTEQNVDWIAGCMDHMRRQGFVSIAPTAEAEAAWTRHVQETAAARLLNTMTESWFFGANTPGKARSVVIYAGGAVAFRKRCDAVAREGYQGFEFR